MFQVWQPVKAKPGHPRGGNEAGEGAQAGIVQAIGEKEGTVEVKWDVDSEVETVKFDQLAAL